MSRFAENFSQFDIIVYDVGKYEVQKIHYKHADFYNWLKVYPKARYISQGEFPDLPIHVKQRYDAWYAREHVILALEHYRKHETPAYIDAYLGHAVSPQTSLDQQIKILQKRLKARDNRLERIERYLATLVDENASEHAKLNVIRWGREVLNLTDD